MNAHSFSGTRWNWEAPRQDRRKRRRGAMMALREQIHSQPAAATYIAAET